MKFVFFAFSIAIPIGIVVIKVSRLDCMKSPPLCGALLL